ncbi:MAG: hypothetical protein AAGI68_09755 [Planctomycetota bacterium]
MKEEARSITDLYEVVSYGSDHSPDGGNGPDTCCLVVADNLEEAVWHAEVNGFRGRTADVVHYLGTLANPWPYSTIIRGPYYQHAVCFGFDMWHWIEDKSGGGVWEKEEREQDAS